MTRAELLERLQPALQVIGEIVVDLVEARLAAAAPSPPPAPAPALSVADRDELVAAVLAELRAGAPSENQGPAGRDRGAPRCRICRLAGHNARTCPDRAVAPAVGCLEGEPVAIDLPATAQPAATAIALLPPVPPDSFDAARASSPPAATPITSARRRPPLPAPSRNAETAARWAKEHGSTLQRAAIVHECDGAEVERAWNQIYPTEQRRRVP